MSTNPNDRKKVMERLSHIRIRLIDTVLATAVDREAHIDKKLAQNYKEQQALKNFIRGLSVIYYFSFLQSNLVEAQWEQIKSNKGTQRKAFKNVDWNKFDLLKYARDCFAHNWDGSIFSVNQGNTKNFNSILSQSSAELLSLNNSKIILGKNAVFECLQLVKSIIQEGDIAV